MFHDILLAFKLNTVLEIDEANKMKFCVSNYSMADIISKWASCALLYTLDDM